MSYDSIIWEIKRRTESFARVDFVYEGRQSNFDTHQLAKSSVSLDFVGKHVCGSSLLRLEFII